tara:strand:- start:5680 stop:8133 length:2454 start_codon:yes stop_codon:yes gene_type:complete
MRIKLLAILFILLISCKKEETKRNPLLAYIPQNSAILIKINDFDLFKSDLKNNNFLKEYQKTKQYSKYIEKLKPLNDIKPKGEGILCFVEVGKENFDFFYKTKKDTSLLAFKDSKNKTVEQLIYENYSFNKITLDHQTIYSYNLGSDTFISSSQLLIENLIRTKEIPKIDETLAKLYTASDNSKSAIFFIHTAYAKSLINAYLNQKNNFKIDAFSDWISLDAIIEQNETKFTGISIANGSDKYLNLFKKIKPLTNNTPNYAPINAEAILSYTFDNFDDYYSNQQKYLESLPKKDTIFNTTQELGIFYLNDKKNVILHTYSSDNILKYISNYANESSNYQGNEILKLTEKNLLKPFQALLSNFNTNYAAVLENAVIFSEDLESIQSTVSSFKNEATFEKSATYLNAKNSISDESNILFIATPDGIQKFLKDDLKKDIYSDLNALDLSNQLFIAQIVSDKNFYHTSFLLKKLVSNTESNITSPLFTIRLDSDVATQPQFVINHRTNKKEIVVQDQDNNLYLISTDGKVLWKKQLKGRIKGKIAQVDLYKNGRLQLALITDNQFLIIDRNGEIVEPFDKTFDSENINFLSVFDYDNNRDYRFLITQNNKILMYNNKGAIVEGFNFIKDDAKITNAPKHFRIHKKDYIAFTEDKGGLRILNRVGSDRIPVKEKFNFSQNEIFLYKNKFSFTDTKGILYQIDEKGAISKNNLSLNKDHGFYTTSNTLASMNDNTLTIKGKKTELELGVYTKPSIFYIYNKIYVSVTDIQNQKIYLFDSNSEPIQNFPVYGNSIIDLADINNDKKIELVAKDLENSLIVYRIN